MSVTPDSTFTNPEQLIADLRRQLLECQAERDEALEQQLARRRALHLHACQSTHWCARRLLGGALGVLAWSKPNRYTSRP